jgi:uncharacterized protein YjiS (DUF1127 family)
MDTILRLERPPARAIDWWSGGTRSFTAWPAALLRALFTWQERARQRHALLALDDHLLKDIGLSRAAIECEAAKPFWRG